MDDTLLLWLIGSASAAVVTMAVLVVVKLVHRSYGRWRGVRSAQYVAAVGELISRSILPERPHPAWRDDALFHDALVNYRLSLVGSERGFVDELVEHLGILDVLRSRMRRRHSTNHRLQAVSTFVDLATESCIPDLRQLLADPNAHIAIHAAKGLSRLRDTESVGAILDRAAVAPSWHAARLADALTGFGYEVGPPVRDWMILEIGADEPPVATISLAIRVLGQVSDVEAEGLLLELLASDFREWRVAAASALGHVGGDGAVLGLINALDDESWPVRARATTALGQLAAPTAVNHLRPLLSDSMWWVRQNSAEAIGRLPGGTQVLVDALRSDDPYAADAALYQLTMRGEIAAALERVRTGSGTELDAELLDHVGQMPVSIAAPPIGSLDRGAAI